jgi:arylsulfatase A
MQDGGTDAEPATLPRCRGERMVPTPNLDRLAADGVRFTQAYVTPQCTPTRATILTGQYTARNRMWHVIPGYGMPWARVREEPFVDNLPRGHFTLAKGLRDAGYRTACIGKWHLTANEDGHYTNLRNNAAPRYAFHYAAAEPSRPGEQNTGDKMVDRLTGEAIAFMEQNRSRPFFCYLAHHTIHGKVARAEPRKQASITPPTWPRWSKWISPSAGCWPPSTASTSPNPCRANRRACRFVSASLPPPHFAA